MSSAFLKRVFKEWVSNGRTDAQMNGRINGRTDKQTDGWTDGPMDRPMNRREDASKNVDFLQYF